MQTNPLRNILDHGWWSRPLKNGAKSWLKIVTLFLIAVTLIFTLERPAPALEVQFSPGNPRLGDTIDLRVNSPSQPTVSFDGQVYAAFPRGTGLWQILVGGFVQAGQVIGALGATVAVTGSHLRWGLFVHGKAIDPVPWREGDFN